MAATTLVLGCRPTLDDVEAEVNAIATVAPGAELLLDPTAAVAASRAPHHTWVHFSGHANPRLGPNRVLVWCDAGGGFSAVDASTLVGMLRTMRLVVLNGCESMELGIALVRAGVPNVVAWRTKVADAAGRLFGQRFWESMVAHAATDDDALRTAVRNAFENSKVAVQTAVESGGALDVGGGKKFAASVPKYELHDPEDAVMVAQAGPGRGRMLPVAGAEKAGRIAVGMPVLLVSLPPALLNGVPSLPEQYEPRPRLEATHRDALLRAGSHAITATTTTGVSGPAGAGKSTTAIVLARDPLVHAHFANGVLWLAFGRERTGTEVLRTLAERLGVAKTDAHTISRALAGQRRLLVLDDLWTEEQLDAFASLTAEGGLLGRLVTTRNDELAGEHAHKVEALEKEEGLRVLVGYMGKSVNDVQGDSATQHLVEMCCGNPAMLRSVAALCKKMSAVPTLAYLEQCRQKLNLAKLPKAGDYEYRTLFDALRGMLQFLGEEDPQLAERCKKLAVFREDAQVPLMVAGQLWGVDEVVTVEAVTELVSWHLVDVDWERRTISLIDLHLDYLRSSAKEDLARWHSALLQGCGRRTLGEGEKVKEEGREVVDDPYWDEGENVLHHLRGCRWAPGALDGEVVHLNLVAQELGEKDAKGLTAIVAASGSLAELQLDGNNIGPEGANAIAEALKVSGSLAELYLGGNGIGDEGAKALADAVTASGSLAKLELYNNDIGDEGAKALADAVTASGSLAVLELYDNEIRDEGAKALAEAVAASGSLTTLTLGYNNIGPDGANAIAEAVRASGSLTSLDVGNNSIGKEMALELVSIFKENQMTSVGLAGCELGDDGAQVVADFVRASGSLATLNLARNKIGPDGAKAIADAVAASGSLAELRLGSNMIGAVGAKAIADAVAASGSLAELTIAENNIGDEGAKALAAAVAASGSLTTLVLGRPTGGNNIGDEGAKALAEAIRASGSLALKTLNVDRAVMDNADLVAACQSKGVRLQ